MVGAVTVGYVAAPGPLFAPPALTGGDGLDESALAFLVQQALLAREKEEAEAVEAAELAELVANLGTHESSGVVLVRVHMLQVCVHVLVLVVLLCVINSVVVSVPHVFTFHLHVIFCNSL